MMYTSRPATDDDRAFAFDLRKRTMRHHVEQAYGPWDEDWQQQLFARNWDPSRVWIIEMDGEPVGRLEIHDRDDEVWLANINILPERQGRGLGSAVIRDLIRRSAPKPVTLRVLKVNAEARSLYERLGFVRTHENETHHFFRFDAASPDGGPSAIDDAQVEIAGTP